MGWFIWCHRSTLSSDLSFTRPQSWLFYLAYYRIMAFIVTQILYTLETMAYIWNQTTHHTHCEQQGIDFLLHSVCCLPIHSLIIDISDLAQYKISFNIVNIPIQYLYLLPHLHTNKVQQILDSLSLQISGATQTRYWG
jgi:hypothetical protein